jgi:hypothetical protein
MSNLLASPTRAADVTYPTDAYTSGDTLTAADLNAKFNEIKAGINDNNTKVGSNTTAIDALSNQLDANTAGAGVTIGDMQYWNGSTWVLVPAPVAPATTHSTLIFCRGVPAWTCPYQIGDTGPAGGIVFYVTDGGAHGLEAAPVDQAISEAWGCNSTDIPGATGTAVGNGKANTAAIIAGCADAGAAAKFANDYTLNGYGDWFLPSKDELNELYSQKGIVGGITSDFYWSSSQSNSNAAWDQGFNNGLQEASPKTVFYRVRAIRAF